MRLSGTTGRTWSTSRTTWSRSTHRTQDSPTGEFALGTNTVHAVDEYTTVDALVYAQLPFRWNDLRR